MLQSESERFLSLPFFTGHETPSCVLVQNHWEEKSKSEKLSESADSHSLGKSSQPVRLCREDAKASLGET